MKKNHNIGELKLWQAILLWLATFLCAAFVIACFVDIIMYNINPSESVYGRLTGF